MIRYALFDSPLGRLLALSHDGVLRALHFEGGRHAPAIAPGWVHDPDCPAVGELRRQLIEYLEGRASGFDLALAPVGTAFQQRVWREIARIPYGETVTYAELTRRCGAGAPRAVGAATGRNPLSIVVPCHRVVGTGGSLTGYAGGLERKAWLLRLEAAARRQAA